VFKGITWRIVGTLDTMVLVFLFSGRVSLAALVGTTEAFTKIILFWVHERAWQRIHWGRGSS
jgi:adenylylsulfate kinase